MLRPERPDGLVADELAALGFGERLLEGSLVLGAHGDWREIILLSELQNNSSECVLGGRRQAADGLDRLFEELGHEGSIADAARPQRLACFLSACARMADRVVVGVIASGSTLTCRIEGSPEASARSYAGRNPAVSSTVSPWPPKARA